MSDKADKVSESAETIATTVNKMSQEAKQTYFRELIGNLGSQQRYTLLYVTFALAAVAILFNRCVLSSDATDLNLCARALMITAMFGFAGSALFNFWWAGCLNRLAVKAIDGRHQLVPTRERFVFVCRPQVVLPAVEPPVR